MLGLLCNMFFTHEFLPSFSSVMKVYNEMQASLPASEPPSVKEDEQAENNHELPRVSLYNEHFPLTGTEMSVITGDDAQCTTQGKRRIAANVSRSIEIIDADRTNKVAHLFETDAASMANCLARLGIPGKHSLLTQRETFDGLYEGILDRVCSHDLKQFHGAVVRFRELCRYKSSALVKALVRKLFETEAVRHALSISLEPEAYDESFAETALLQDAKLNVAACFRHLSVDPAFARMLTTDKSFLDLLGRCLNQESVDSIRHTVGFSFENRLCQTIVTCAY